MFQSWIEQFSLDGVGRDSGEPLNALQSSESQGSSSPHPIAPPLARIARHAKCVEEASTVARNETHQRERSADGHVRIGGSDDPRSQRRTAPWKANSTTKAGSIQLAPPRRFQTINNFRLGEMEAKSG